MRFRFRFLGSAVEDVGTWHVGRGWGLHVALLVLCYFYLKNAFPVFLALAASRDPQILQSAQTSNASQKWK